MQGIQEPACHLFRRDGKKREVRMPSSTKRTSPVDLLFNSLDRMFDYCDSAVTRMEMAVPRAVWLGFRVVVIVRIVKWAITGH